MRGPVLQQLNQAKWGKTKEGPWVCGGWANWGVLSCVPAALGFLSKGVVMKATQVDICGM